MRRAEGGVAEGAAGTSAGDHGRYGSASSLRAYVRARCCVRGAISGAFRSAQVEARTHVGAQIGETWCCAMRVQLYFL